VSVVAKVRDKAAGVYGQAKAKYGDSNAWQRAGHVTDRIRAKATSGQLAGKLRDASGKATSGQLAGKLRDASGKATSGQLAGKLRDASGKATAAMRDARARRHSHQ
jgi:uncharacterized protein YjbJ (UPF0337 family)